MIHLFQRSSNKRGGKVVDENQRFWENILRSSLFDLPARYGGDLASGWDDRDRKDRHESGDAGGIGVVGVESSFS
jgi:hypothetical protein